METCEKISMVDPKLLENSAEQKDELVKKSITEAAEKKKKIPTTLDKDTVETPLVHFEEIPSPLKRPTSEAVLASIEDSETTTESTDDKQNLAPSKTTILIEQKLEYNEIKLTTGVDSGVEETDEAKLNDDLLSKLTHNHCKISSYRFIRIGFLKKIAVPYNSYQ